MHWMTTEQFAAHVGVLSPATVRRMCHDGELRCFKRGDTSGGKWVVHPDALEEAMEQQMSQRRPQGWEHN